MPAHSTMGPRLLAGLLATFLAVFASAGVGVWKMGEIRRQTHFIGENSLVAVEILDRLDAGLADRRDARLGIIEATDLGARANFTRRFFRANRQITQALEDYQGTIVDGRDRQLYDVFTRRLMEFNALASSASTDGDTTDAVAEARATGPQFDALRGALLAVRNNNLGMARRAMARADDAEQQGRIILVLAALLAGGIGLGVAEVVTLRRLRGRSAASRAAIAETAAANLPPRETRD